MFGENDLFELHMQGIKKMVDMRGGLRELGYKGVLQKALCWYVQSSRSSTVAYVLNSPGLTSVKVCF